MNEKFIIVKIERDLKWWHHYPGGRGSSGKTGVGAGVAVGAAATAGIPLGTAALVLGVTGAAAAVVGTLAASTSFERVLGRAPPFSAPELLFAAGTWRFPVRGSDAAPPSEASPFTLQVQQQ